MILEITICTEEEDDVELVADCDYQPGEKAVYYPNDLAHPGCAPELLLNTLWRTVAGQKTDVTLDLERYVDDDVLWSAFEDQISLEPDPDALRDEQLERNL